MSGTGATEITNILARLAEAGTVFDGVKDDAALPVDWSGGSTSYMVPLFLDPVPTARDRVLGVGEEAQPQVLPFQVTYVGPTQAAVRALRIAGDGKLIGWSPNTSNATEIKAAGGRTPPSLDTGSTPTEVRRIRYYECRLSG